MDTKDKDARKRIINAATEMLVESADTENITIRQIAERAKVGIGLINYHFKSRDNLLSIAIGEIMATMANSFMDLGSRNNQDPAEKLKLMLKELCKFGVPYEKLMKFTISYGIMNGDNGAMLYLIPVLREIFGSAKEEMELRIIAMQILLPIQVTSISPTSFHLYSGLDLRNEAQRNKFIDLLVDNVIK